MTQGSLGNLGARKCRAILGSLALLACVLFAGCGDDEAPEPLRGAGQTVVMIVLEGTTPEFLASYALQDNRMPALAKLARESTWFDRHWAQNSGKNAAFASLLSGLYSSKHGLGALTRVGRERLSSSVTLLPEDLSANGFECLGSVGTHKFASEFSGFDQGWSNFASPPFLKRTEHRNAGEVLDAVWENFEAQQANSDSLFALFEFADAAHIFEAPDRLVGPAMVQHLRDFEDELPELTEHLKGLEGGSLEPVSKVQKLLARRRGHPVRAALTEAFRQAQHQFLDEQIKRVFDSLRSNDRYEDALILVTGNVGPVNNLANQKREFGEFELRRMRIPLLLRLPGGERSQPIQSITQAIDVRPTVLTALGIEANDFDGVSFLPLVREPGSTNPHEHVFFEGQGLGEAAAIDDFWFVRSRAGVSALPLDESRHELVGDDVPPVPKTMLRRTRKALREFVGEPQLSIDLAPGSDVQYTLGIKRLAGSWLDLELTGNEILEAGPGSTGERLADADIEQLSALMTFTLATQGQIPRPSGLRLWADDDAPSFMLSLKSSAGELDEHAIRFGGRDLAHLALPRLPDRVGADWPANEDGSTMEPIVDITRETGRWLNVRIGGEVGQKVELLLVGEPLATRDWAKLNLNGSGNYTVREVPGRPDCAWVDGETPLAISAQLADTWKLGLAVALEGEQVSAQSMRFLGKRFVRPGTIKLVALDWLPGVREHLERSVESFQTARDPGSLFISCRTRRQFANDREVPSQNILDKLQTLGTDD